MLPQPQPPSQIPTAVKLISVEEIIHVLLRRQINILTMSGFNGIYRKRRTYTDDFFANITSSLITILLQPENFALTQLICYIFCVGEVFHFISQVSFDGTLENSIWINSANLLTHKA